MLTTISKIFGRNNYTNLNILFNKFHTSYIKLLQQDWRIKKGLTENPNAFGPLTNMADYSYKDGRPTPLGTNQKRRIIKQQEYTKRIHKLVKEIDNAVERHVKLQEIKAQEKQRILDSKLKPKGDLLLKTQKPTT
ncbi:39S ribosomal protein L52, mitochondrial [Vespa velutina]|uniref:39S ribosomal protein L52, mitochondrial n=1 Tax=Vespa velutina TaxID=202808 RepID=UPI001FB5689C|nr:39S ribosomal protein L52, mitochondrial [Vespa velutina]